MARKPKKQRRTVSMSMLAPVGAMFTVDRAAADPGAWEVVAVRRVDCDLTPHGAMEHMTDDDRDELNRLANAAADDLP